MQLAPRYRLDLELTTPANGDVRINVGNEALSLELIPMVVAISRDGVAVSNDAGNNLALGSDQGVYFDHPVLSSAQW